MASDKVISATRMWSRRSSDATTSDKFSKLTIRFEEGWHIHTEPDATELDIYNYAGLPGVAKPYEFFSFAYAEAMRLIQISPVVWNAIVPYSGEFSGFDPQGKPKSPLLAPPVIKWGAVQSSEEIDSDYEGKPFTNTIGDRVSGIQKLIFDQTLYVKRNYATFDQYTQAAYYDATNSDLFKGWPPGTAKLMQLDAVEVAGGNESGIGYFEVEGLIQFRRPRPGGDPAKVWYARYANKGKREKKIGLVSEFPLAEFIVQATGEDGTAIEVFLKEDGTRATEDEAFYPERKIYGDLPYNALGLI